MIKKITIIWALGLMTIVPYGVYYLFFEASRDEYAILITFILFWIFGFWAVVSPILSAIKLRKIFKELEKVDSKEKLQEMIKNKKSDDAVIELIASENNIPKFIAKKIYLSFVNKLTK